LDAAVIGAHFSGMMLRLFRSGRYLVPVLLALLGLPRLLDAQDRTMNWPAFDVQAHLDSTGALQVREQQTIRFTGDWNGGERIFTVGFGQGFTFKRLLRIDSLTGAEVALREGVVDEIDEYSWGESNTLRWRSRLPGDPPFDSTLITYVLEYEYRDILVPTDSGYTLDHEFGFRDRYDYISNFTLAVTFDSSWARPASFAGAWREDTLAPGIGFVVSVPIVWKGAGFPSNVWRGASVDQRRVIAGVLVLGMMLLTTALVVVQYRAGKFTPLLPRDHIDEAWLQMHVFSMPAELAGAAWDDHIGAAEVSATLARMVGEKKLSSRVTTDKVWLFKRHVLHLELTASRPSLAKHERQLVDALFGSNATTTDTDAVRKRYASSGFNPVSYIEGPLSGQLHALPDIGGKAAPHRGRRVTVALMLVAFVLLGFGIRERGVDVVIAIAAVMISLPIYGIARAFTVSWRNRVIRPVRHMAWFLAPMCGAATALWWLLDTGRHAVGALSLAGLVVWLLALLQSVLNAARSTQSPERIRFRKRLAAAREYFRVELKQAVPRLREEWYPHLLAFGLGRHVDRWFNAFGGTNAAATTTASSRDRDRSFSTSGGGVSTSASGGSSWGGFGSGGGFAGAGATVAFGSALGAMSSGVSAPSSSSSGGSSSGGSSGGGSSSSGGSSGGGGGGGW